jgi:hypothetical protein
MPSKHDSYVVPVAASEEILVASAAAYRSERRSSPAFDPAMGTLVVSPDHDLKIRNALRREKRCVAFRLLLRQPRLEVEYLLLKMHHAALRLRRRFMSKLSKLLVGSHSSQSFLVV